MKRRYRDSKDGKEFDLIYHHSGLFAMCDLLGFSEYVKNNDSIEVYDTIIDSVLQAMKSIKDMKLGDILQESKWLKYFGFSYKIISDSFIFYPNKELETKQHIGYFLSLMQALLEKLFALFLNMDNDILLRGVLMYGDYAYTEKYSIIMGKGIIDAYRYEKMQDWAGILIHPTLTLLLKNHNYRPNIGIQYTDIPLKNNKISTKYRHELAKDSLQPYVINWVDAYRKAHGDLKEDFWYKKIDKVLEFNGENKQSAINKILNTKKFYDYVVSQTELG